MPFYYSIFQLCSFCNKVSDNSMFKNMTWIHYDNSCWSLSYVSIKKGKFVTPHKSELDRSFVLISLVYTFHNVGRSYRRVRITLNATPLQQGHHEKKNAKKNISRAVTSDINICMIFIMYVAFFMTRLYAITLDDTCIFFLIFKILVVINKPVMYFMNNNLFNGSSLRQCVDFF